MKVLSTYIHRALLMTIAMLGAWITLGGHLGALEWLFVLLCLALNEARHWFRLDRWPRLMFIVWLSAFLQLPTGYFILKLFPGFPDVLPNAPLSPDLVLPVAVVAMALPFQVFASYYNSMPRAHHLIMIFALVESVLAAKAGAPSPLWLWLLLLLSVMALSLAFGTTQDQVQEAKAATAKSRGIKSIVEEGPAALVKLGNVLWVVFLVPLLLMLAFSIYSLLPQRAPEPDEPLIADSVPSIDAQEDPKPREKTRFPNESFPIDDELPEEQIERTSGLSDRVTLGGFGDILLDNTR